MTKALSSYAVDEREDVARRRIQAQTGGCGFHAAVDYMKIVHPKAKAVPVLQNTDDIVVEEHELVSTERHLPTARERGEQLNALVYDYGDLAPMVIIPES
jgi:hypothetical protein